MFLTSFITGSGTSMKLANYISGAKARLLIIVILPFHERDLCLHIDSCFLGWLSWV